MLLKYLCEKFRGSVQFLRRSERSFIGLAEKAEGVWGHGGQTLGFESDIAFFEDPSLSMVGWASSANNIMAIGVGAVSGALVNAGVLPDPSVALDAELRSKMTGSEWQLVSIKTGEGETLQPSNPEDYRIAFDAAGSFASFSQPF